MTIPVALATATQPKRAADEVIGDCVSVVRNSPTVKKYAATYAQILRDVLDDKPLADALKAVGGIGLERSVNTADPVVA